MNRLGTSVSHIQDEFFERVDAMLSVEDASEDYVKSLEELDERWTGILGKFFGRLCKQTNEATLEDHNSENIKSALIDLTKTSKLWYDIIIKNHLPPVEFDESLTSKMLVLRDFPLMLRKERVSQIETWGHQKHQGYLWISIIGEELGEICEAYHDVYRAYNYDNFMSLAYEIIQLSAVCLAWYEHIETQNIRS